MTNAWRVFFNQGKKEITKGEVIEAFSKCVNNNVIAVGWTGRQDLENLSKESKSFRHFHDEMRQGDLVLFRKSQKASTYLLGELTSDHMREDKSSPPLIHELFRKLRDVKWLLDKKEFEMKGSTGQTAVLKLNYKKHLSRITDQSVIAILREKGLITASQKNERFGIKLNTILYGPPGTGKTYEAREYAKEIIGGV